MGFYRTYEELKQPWVSVRNWKSNRRFYRTYEELKLGIDYITGLIVAGVFLSYLWGIETCLRFAATYRTRKCFYRTYEELKQINYVIIDFMINTVFIVPMRNWNSI